MANRQPLELGDGGPRFGPPLRLKRRKDFLKAAGGRKIHASLLSVHAVLRAEAFDGTVRVGYTVTKKVGKAVERNRIKRRLKEIIRTVPNLCMKPSNDYVIVARRELLTVSQDAIVAGLQAAVRRVHSPPGRGRAPGARKRSDVSTIA